ncbi:hypothetical protein [Enterococcus casseliflavus]|uniref:hypothetical protein n=1 Tax=Enterococcus casseliflavus TaxID=37734 RepID=UPI001F5F20BF|nr:hypothetical protein [Enterococcus casseliflavus]
MAKAALWEGLIHDRFQGKDTLKGGASTNEQEKEKGIFHYHYWLTWRTLLFFNHECVFFKHFLCCSAGGRNGCE